MRPIWNGLALMGVLLGATLSDSNPYGAQDVDLEQLPKENKMPYPNPTDDFVHLVQISKWELSSPRGKLLFSGESKDIDLSKIPAGLYFLSYWTDDKKRITQLIVN